MVRFSHALTAMVTVFALYSIALNFRPSSAGSRILVRARSPPAPELSVATVVTTIMRSEQSMAALDPSATTDVLNAANGGPHVTISCPMFSGPGYDKKRHPSHSVNIPKLQAPFLSSFLAPEQHQRRLSLVALADVRLLPGSAFERAFATNLAFLKRVDLQALLLTWRLAAGKRWPKNTVRERDSNPRPSAQASHPAA